MSVRTRSVQGDSLGGIRCDHALVLGEVATARRWRCIGDRASETVTLALPAGLDQLPDDLADGGDWIALDLDTEEAHRLVIALTSAVRQAGGPFVRA